MFIDMVEYQACPCKGCVRPLKKKKPIECHDTCEAYQDFKKGLKNAKSQDR